MWTILKSPSRHHGGPLGSRIAFMLFIAFIVFLLVKRGCASRTHRWWLSKTTALSAVHPWAARARTHMGAPDSATVCRLAVASSAQLHRCAYPEHCFHCFPLQFEKGQNHHEGSYFDHFGVTWPPTRPLGPGCKAANWGLANCWATRSGVKK